MIIQSKVFDLLSYLIINFYLILFLSSFLCAAEILILLLIYPKKSLSATVIVFFNSFGLEIWDIFTECSGITFVKSSEGSPTVTSCSRGFSSSYETLRKRERSILFWVKSTGVRGPLWSSLIGIAIGEIVRSTCLKIVSLWSTIFRDCCLNPRLLRKVAMST